MTGGRIAMNKGKKKKKNLLRKIMAVLFAAVFLAGAVPSDALALETDTMSYTLNITIEGYEGNDPAVLGAITLKRLLPTEEEWTPVPSMTGNVITCTVEIPNTGTYQWNLGGTPFAYQEALNGQGVSSSYSPKFFPFTLRMARKLMQQNMCQRLITYIFQTR